MRHIYLFILVVVFLNISTYSQCANTANIYTFSYSDKSYEVVKENKTWVEAAACAVERGGYLARIDNQEEQDAIFNELLNNAGIVLTETSSSDGGNASYVWLGGNDKAEEGVWIWDGDNDGVGDQFWHGSSNGNPVGGLYNNWGTEPDNYNNNQDALGIALTEWPLGIGSLGSAGQWNDIAETNSLYYIIEYDNTNGVGENQLYNPVQLFPNPANLYFTVSFPKNMKITSVKLSNIIGALVFEQTTYKTSEIISIEKLLNGIYFVSITNNKGETFVRELIVKR